jgi:hypothetical protein
VPCPTGETWASLRDAISAHPKVTGASFNDSLMRASFKTDMSFATYGQNLTAVVSREPDGSRVTISGVAKRPSFGGRDQARIRKITNELLDDLAVRLGQVAAQEDAPTRSEQLRAGISGRSIAEQLSEYAILRDRGMISAAEFDDHKRWLLRGW